jgi:gluconokinase
MVSVITVMGVSGCGKTTIGSRLANRLGWKFIESDDYHSEADIQKMSGGIPLSDADRWPWLECLNLILREEIHHGRHIVLACSALKQSYREKLYTGIHDGVYVYLKGSYDLIRDRMQQREHFMKADMLQSQFDTLEEPQDAILIDIHLTEHEIIDQIMRKITQE